MYPNDCKNADNKCSSKVNYLNNMNSIWPPDWMQSIATIKMPELVKIPAKVAQKADGENRATIRKLTRDVLSVLNSSELVQKVTTFDFNFRLFLLKNGMHVTNKGWDEVWTCEMKKKCDDMRKILTASWSWHEFNEFMSAHSRQHQMIKSWAYERVEDERHEMNMNQRIKVPSKELGWRGTEPGFVLDVFWIRSNKPILVNITDAPLKSLHQKGFWTIKQQVWITSLWILIHESLPIRNLLFRIVLYKLRFTNLWKPSFQFRF